MSEVRGRMSDVGRWEIVKFGRWERRMNKRKAESAKLKKLEAANGKLFYILFSSINKLTNQPGRI